MRDKISATLMGHPVSVETRRKLSVATRKAAKSRPRIKQKRPNPKAAYPLSKVQYTPGGRAYVEQLSRKVSGEVVLVRRYGEIRNCVECGGEFLSVNKSNLGYCSRSCGHKGRPKRALMTKTGMKIYCDQLFSIAVRALGYCERCGVTDYPLLQCAHIISRRYLTTRWNRDNAMCLCRGCHLWGTHRPLEWEDFVDETYGAGHYEVLKNQARQTAHNIDYFALLERLEELVRSTPNIQWPKHLAYKADHEAFRRAE